MVENTNSNEVNFVEDEPCPRCGGLEIILHDESGVWQCKKCHLIWAAVVKKGHFVISRYNENENQVKQEEKL